MRGLALLIYGGEGMGKTGTALQFAHLGPLTCISVGETGYEYLEIINEVPAGCTNYIAESYEEVHKITKSMKEGVLVIDSLSGLQKLLFDYVCRIVYKGKFDEFSSYWKGQRVDSPIYFDAYLDLLNSLCAKGIHVILIGHCLTTEVLNALGPDYVSHVLDMDYSDKGTSLRACVTKWAQAILFMDIDISITRVTERAKDKTVLEGKAKDNDNRLIYTTKSPNHSAKNKLQLPSIIPMGESAKEAFKNLWAAMPQAYKDLV